jgi:antitoxin Phd
VVILRNNVPRYVVLDFDQLQQDEDFADAEVASLGRRLIAQHRAAFEALAKGNACQAARWCGCTAN